MSEVTLIDRIICAAAQIWKDDGEVLATGIGIVPRLAASLCMVSINTDLMMTDSEAWIVQEPVPIGPRGGYQIKRESHMGCARIFDNVWGGTRHAMEHLFQRETAPKEIHVWIMSLEGADQALAERIAQTVDVR